MEVPFEDFPFDPARVIVKVHLQIFDGGDAHPPGVIVHVLHPVVVGIEEAAPWWDHYQVDTLLVGIGNCLFVEHYQTF